MVSKSTAEVHNAGDGTMAPEHHRRSPIVYIVIFVLTGGLLVVPLISRIQNFSAHGSARGSVCQNAPLRQEWRTLKPAEKADYLDAVRCLQTVPPRLDSSRSLYDDFSWTHMHPGRASHGTTAFLTWHRYFIHVYEDALRENCNYTRALTYWDWTKDSKDLTRSPIWKSELGFGGNGNLSAGPSVGFGYCVTEGPFAYTEVPFYGLNEDTHCLSRGFRSGEPEQCSDPIKPRAIETLLDAMDYQSFNRELEEGAHRAIPYCLRGDWLRLTVPYDPVFLLHHTQVDRLWWLWQNRDIDTRSGDYPEAGSVVSDDNASSFDIIDLGGLSAPVTVADIMRTNSDLLCYRY